MGSAVCGEPKKDGVEADAGVQTRAVVTEPGNGLHENGNGAIEKPLPGVEHKNFGTETDVSTAKDNPESGSTRLPDNWRLANEDPNRLPENWELQGSSEQVGTAKIADPAIAGNGTTAGHEAEAAASPAQEAPAAEAAVAPPAEAPVEAAAKPAETAAPEAGAELSTTRALEAEPAQDVPSLTDQLPDVLRGWCGPGTKAPGEVATRGIESVDSDAPKADFTGLWELVAVDGDLDFFLSHQDFSAPVQNMLDSLNTNQSPVMEKIVMKEDQMQLLYQDSKGEEVAQILNIGNGQVKGVNAAKEVIVLDASWSDNNQAVVIKAWRGTEEIPSSKRYLREKDMILEYSHDNKTMFQIFSRMAQY